MGFYWGDRGHCPGCGRFCGGISAMGHEMMGLVGVTGICKTHGEVDLTGQEWSWDDFFGPDCDYEIMKKTEAE